LFPALGKFLTDVAPVPLQHGAYACPRLAEAGWSFDPEGEPSAMF
jgi:hypothetical protein